MKEIYSFSVDLEKKVTKKSKKNSYQQRDQERGSS